MTPEQATFLLTEIYLPQMQNEHKTTRRVIQAIPADKADWKPDPKAKSALELAWHIAASECFFINGIVNGQFGSGGSMPESIKTPEGVLNWYDENFAKATAALAGLEGESLLRLVDFRGVFKFPAIFYAGLMCNHSIHHRGQLSTYLRPMGSNIPRIYGGSADEPMEIPARAQT